MRRRRPGIGFGTPLGTWMRGRPETSAVAVWVVLYAAVESAGNRGELSFDADGSLSLRSSADVGLVAGAAVAMLFGLMRLIVYSARRWGSTSEGERAARWLARPRWRCPWQWLVAGAGAAGAVYLLWLGVGHGLERLWFGARGTMNDLPDRSASTIWAAVIAWSLCAPVVEELLYRGGLQSWLGRRLPGPAAVVLATAVFTAAHGVGPGAYTGPQLVAVFGTGLVYALLYHVTGSVLPSIGAHAAWNTMSLLGATTGLLVAVLVAGVMVAAGIAVRKPLARLASAPIAPGRAGQRLWLP